MTVTEGNSGTDDRRLHRHPVRRQRPDGHRQLRHRPTAPPPPAATTRPPPARLTFAPGETQPDRHRARSTATRTVEADETFLVNLTGADQRHDRRRPGRRHDHQRRRRADASPITDVTVTEGNSGTQRRRLHRHPVRRQRPDGHRRLRHRRRHRHAPAATTPPSRGTADLRPRRDEQDRHRRSSTATPLDEADETFFVNLTDADQRHHRRRPGRRHDHQRRRRPPIIDQRRDGRPRATAAPSTATFTVTLSAASGQTVTVQLRHRRTARPPPAATTPAASGHADLRPGRDEPRRSPSPVNGDTLDRGRRDVLRQPVNADQRDASPTARASARSPTTTPPPTLSINDVTVTEGNSGTTAVAFTVTLSAASGQTGHRQLRHRQRHRHGRRATTRRASGTLTFAPGETHQDRHRRRSTATPSSRPTRRSSSTSPTPTNATIADGQGVGTITNDDAAPTVTISDVTVDRGQQRHHRRRPSPSRLSDGQRPDRSPSTTPPPTAPPPPAATTPPSPRPR